MIRTLIVDDDALLRAALRSMVDWEKLGYGIVADCTNGLQALELLQRRSVDLLITDMKMPGGDGLGLLRSLREGACMPVTVVLSGYDEYELVREAFRLGAHDYLLKGKLDAASLTKMLQDLRQGIFADAARRPEQAQGGENLAPGSYGAAIFSVDDLSACTARFGGDLREKLDKPMLELARQIPRVAGRASIRAAGPGQYELFWQVRDKTRYYNTMLSVVRQIQSVWRDYMNLSVSAAMSDMVDREGLRDAAELCGALLCLAALDEPGVVCTQHGSEALARDYLRLGPACDGLVEALHTGSEEEYERQQAEFFRQLDQLQGEEHTRRVLVLLARLAYKQRECGLPGTGSAGRRQAVQALASEGERSLWLRNVLRQEREGSGKKRWQADPIARARRFMEDNFTDHSLTLKMVADQVGFNEKYFSAQFTKRCGCTFVAYLNQLRLRYAQQLLSGTDLKIYEISDRAGYNSIEHFTHTFKKNLGISPKDYRMKGENT